MVLQRKPKNNLLELLESHARRSVPELAIYTLPSESTDKKRKQDKKGKEATKEGEVITSKELEP